MTVGFRNSAGTDLDDLFLANNSNAGAIGFIASNGQDLGNRYANGSLGYNVGYKTSSGTDIGFIRGRTPPYTKVDLTGSGTFTVPDGVITLRITLAGGGGTNGSSARCGLKKCHGGTGGTGGLYVGTISVSSWQQFSYSVGGVGGTTSFGGYKATGGSRGGNASSSGSGKDCHCSRGSAGANGTPAGNGGAANNGGWLSVEYGEGI